MNAKVTSSHYNNGITVELVTHYGYGDQLDEYTIQICEHGEWSRFGGRNNYITNHQEAQRQFWKACEVLNNG